MSLPHSPDRTPQEPVETIIIGGGLSGMTAAYRLQKAGRSYLLFERASKLGGKIKTIHDQGFMIEAGPHTIHSRGESLIQLSNDLNLQKLKPAPGAKKRYIFHNLKLEALPTNPLGMLTSPLLTPKAKLRLACEPLLPIKPMTIEQTVEAWAQYRLGPEVVSTLLDPFMSGVYAATPDKVSVRAIFPKFAEWHDQNLSLTAGFLKHRHDPKVPYQLYSYHNGLYELIQALMDNLAHYRIKTQMPVSDIQKLDNGFYEILTEKGERYYSKNVIIATEAFHAASMVRVMSGGLADRLSRIPYVPLVVIHLGFRAQDIPHDLDGFGCLIPRHYKLPLLGAIWTSSLFPERAPKDHCLLTCMLGGSSYPALIEEPDPHLFNLTLNNLAQVFSSGKTLNPTYRYLVRWNHAIPVYAPGHLSVLDAIEMEQRRFKGLFFAGNYLKGIALHECVSSAENAVKTILGQQDSMWKDQYHLQ